MGWINLDENGWTPFVCMAAVVIGIGALSYWMATGPCRGREDIAYSTECVSADTKPSLAKNKIIRLAINKCTHDRSLYDHGQYSESHCILPSGKVGLVYKFYFQCK